MHSRKQDHDFVVKPLTTIVKNCEKREIDAEVVVQTMLSVALTVAISTSNIGDVANLLESLAAGIRRGEFTGNDDGIGSPDWPKHQ
jgi:hypothetical protein